MVKHCIIMASAYSIGKRIALDYCGVELKLEDLQAKLDYIIKVCGEDIPISTHFVQTYSEDYKSIVKKDKFFDKVIFIENEEDFIKLILSDRELSGLDVAKYILTLVPCTHLKLEKLVYLCYADYLYQEGDRLFKDKIYAYKYGPVIESVYQKYKKSGHEKLAREDDKKIYSEEDRRLPVRSRIMASKAGVRKLFSIDKTIEKYKNLTASQLVDLTHKEQTPWNKAGAGSFAQQEISDKLIMEYHKYEVL